MNDTDRELVIVLGVGLAGHLSAGTVEFVAAQAANLDLGVEVVHVVPVHVGDESRFSHVGITFDALVERGQEALDAAVRTVRDRVGSAHPVSGTLLRGGVVQTLVERSKQAHLLVLQRSEASRWERWTSGSTIASVATSAHAPVVAVPAAWTPRTPATPITVGVDDADRSRAQLGAALDWAEAHDLPVRILRATFRPSVYETLLLPDVTHHDVLVAAREADEREVDLPQELRDRVEVTFEVMFGGAVDEIVYSGFHSSLIVLARRDPRFPFGSHLGPVVRHVLREAACPVMVVEPSYAELATESLGGATRTAEPARLAGSTR